jgi:short-subunit dehydrogenase
VVANFSSGWGRSTSPEAAAYFGTKWSFDFLTTARAQELPAGLATMPLNPGIIDTRMLRSCFGVGAGSYPTPEEWAKVAVSYLISLSICLSRKALTVPGM